MHRNEKLVLIAAVGTVAVVTIQIVQDIKRQRAIRKQFAADTKAQIRRIKRAAAVVCERINDGQYNGKNINHVMNDFEFEIIVADEQ